MIYNEDGGGNYMKKLVAYYSRAGENYFGGKLLDIDEGNTEVVAKMIAKIINADLFKIEQEIPYSDDYMTCINQAKKDLNENARPKLVSYIENISEYDEIYLGYPNYWGKMPMAVYSFLESIDLKGKIVHPFCTHEGSGLSNTVADIRVITNANVTDGLAILGSKVKNSFSAVKEWLK